MPVHPSHGHTTTFWVQNSNLLGLGYIFLCVNDVRHRPDQPWCMSWADVSRITSSGRVADVTRSSCFPPGFRKRLVTDLTSFRFELIIVWRIQIDEEGKVLPKLDLLTKVPQRGRGPVWCSSDLLCPTDTSLCPLALRGKNQKSNISLVCFLYQFKKYFHQ